jgi:phage baseplate assembly protein W
VAATEDIHLIAQQQIRDLVVTAQNERAMRPDYGGGVATRLFENMNELELADASDEIRQRAQEAVRVAIVNEVSMRPMLTTDGREPTSSLECVVLYSIPPMAQSFVTTFVLSGILTEESRFS